MATLKRLQDLIDRFEPEIRKGFQEAIRNVKSDAVLSEIEKAIRAGDINQALRFTGISEAALRPLTDRIERAYETGGVFTADQIKRPVGQAAFRFDVRNSRAEAWLRQHSSQLVTNITNQQMDMLRDAIQSGVARGINPANIALDLVGRIDPITKQRVGGLIGLDNRRAQYLQSAKDELTNLDPNYLTRSLRDKRFDSVFQKALDNGTPLSQEQIDGMTTRYSNNLLRARGETIARTEAIASLNNSQQEAMQQLVDTGSVDAQDVTRIWEAVDHGPPTGKTRETHAEMHGQKVGMDEPFISPSGARMMFPGDTSLGAPPEETINCRCRVSIRVDYLRKWKGRI